MKKGKLLYSLEDLENDQPKVSMSIPLFIRLLEYAREDAKTDMDLHNVSEKLISICNDGTVADMSQYEQIINNQSVADE